MNFGHLCCAKYPDNGLRELSCYRCGLRGHTGLACTTYRGETGGIGSLNPYYRCDEEGHFARECTNLSKPKKKVQKKRKEKKEFISKPHDFGRAWKKKGKNEGGYKSGYKVKQKGGRISDDPEDYPQPINWRSPLTPRNKRAKISNFSTGGNSSVPHSSRTSNRLDFDNSSSYGSGNYNYHRFSASGGTGGGIAYNREEFEAICKSGLADSLISQEDKLIFVDKLMELWVVEGFLKVEEMKSVEEKSSNHEYCELSQSIEFSKSTSAVHAVFLQDSKSYQFLRGISFDIAIRNFDDAAVSPPRPPQFLPISLGVYSQYRGVTEEPNSDEYDEDFYVDNTPPHC
ncbi:hypothetical protein CQW23_07481 [Capsicum baccatum]|uniref:CCHC-type domain-containing protein n=1 Tax=Capsicum baccatum TaxID=33114 RepID=A0A2G2X6H1_CAPBA|nr:hypothetical protein CQW23_07481 [Capsicum baccatum]